MSPRRRFLLALAGLWLLLLGLLVGWGALLWADLGAAERAALASALAARAWLLGLLAALLLIALAILLDRLFGAYVAPLRALAEQTRLVATSNPEHRVGADGAAELRQLAEAIDALAGRYRALQADVGAQIDAARADLAEERNRLAALMSELAQSVLVCNLEGRILLYNSRARLLFGPPSGAGGLVGLGRSIFGVIDRELIVHALESLHHQLALQRAAPVASFVVAPRDGQLIRADVAPVLDQQGQIGGFVLTLEDVSRRAAAGERRDLLLQELAEATRSSLANIRAAIETLLGYPDLEAERRARLSQIIRDESLALSGQLDQALAATPERLAAEWALADMLGADLLAAASRRIAGELGLGARVEADEELWLTVDSFAIVSALLALAGRLRRDLGIDAVALRLRRAGRFAQLDLAWAGPTPDVELLRAWLDQPPGAAEGGRPSARAVVERHGGEIWCQAERDPPGACIRLLLPAAAPEPAWSAAPTLGSRPEYYDFDLFRQRDQHPQLDQRRLSELSYTVFDTETTGLDPAGGDEIVAIGAVRIVNGRLLRHELFEQLVDPRRPIGHEALLVHGITPQLLRGQPTIAQVLPLFRQFVEDTVLVAHNAAFDMRFLQLKEAQTGIVFDNPVLDTLLLAAVAQPDQASHGLEALAERLGVSMIGRHTALGDAIVTGEVFLRLLPLLADRGVLTLGDARAAAQKTYYARIRY